MNDTTTRVSDHERERAAARLRDAAGEGRLEMEELEQRLDAVFAAKTRAELDWLTTDLPAPRRPRAPLKGSDPFKRVRGGEGRAYLATMVLLVAIWALTGAGYFWPIWPILGWGLAFVPFGPFGHHGHGCGKHRRRVPG